MFSHLVNKDGGHVTYRENEKDKIVAEFDTCTLSQGYVFSDLSIMNQVLANFVVKAIGLSLNQICTHFRMSKITKFSLLQQECQCLPVNFDDLSKENFMLFFDSRKRYLALEQTFGHAYMELLNYAIQLRTRCRLT